MSATDAGSTPKLRVLIADDFHETRRSVRLMLSMNPDVVVVAIAKDGREAVELAREHHPDIVILDINMPQLDGLTAFKQISEIYADTGCILISAQREHPGSGYGHHPRCAGIPGQAFYHRRTE